MERTGKSRKPGTRRKPNKALLEARIRHGLSREALAYQAGLSRKQVRSLELGLAYPREETAVEVARALELVDDEGNPDPTRLWPLNRHPLLRSGS